MECEDNEDGGVLSGECARKKGLLAKTCPRRSADPMSSVEKLKARGPVETVCTAFCPGGTGLWRWFSRGFRRQRPAVTFWSSKPAEPVSSVVFCPGGVKLCKHHHHHHHHHQQQQQPQQQNHVRHSRPKPHVFWVNPV